MLRYSSVSAIPFNTMIRVTHEVQTTMVLEAIAAAYAFWVPRGVTALIMRVQLVYGREIHVAHFATRQSRTALGRGLDSVGLHECKKIGDGWRLTGFAFVIEVVPLARYEIVGCGTAIVFVAAT